MDLPLINYVVAAGVLIVTLVVIVALVRKGRSKRAAENPYIEALKDLVDGDEERAFRNLQTAVKSGAAPTDAYIKLGSLLRARGEATRALQIHQSLTVKTNLTRSEKTELFMNIADDYESLGNAPRSITVLESAIRNLEIREAGVFVTLARRYHKTGDFEKAYETLKEARKLGGISERELALYLTSFGERLADKGDLKEAKKVLQRALKHDSNCAPCLLVLGNISEKADDLDDAIERWKRVALLSPPLAATVLAKLEATLYEEGRFGDIERIYEEVRSTRGDDEAASISLAAYYKKQGRGDDAIDLLEEYLGTHPESFRGSILLTSLYSSFRDAETLERFLDQSFKAARVSNGFRCSSCRFQSRMMRWHCPSCSAFDSFSTNHEK